MAGSLFLAIILIAKCSRCANPSNHCLLAVGDLWGGALFLLWKIMYNKEAGLINTLLVPVIRFFNLVRAKID